MKYAFSLIAIVFAGMLISADEVRAYWCGYPDACYEVEFQNAGFCRQEVWCAGCGAGEVELCNSGYTTVDCICEPGPVQGGSPCSPPDGVCDGAIGEDQSTCPEDCGYPPPPPPPDPYCGDGSCNGGESTASCSADCGSSCGDGSCNGGESTASCSADCGSSCGDGSCNGGESCSSCSGDCGACAPSCGDGTCNGGETCSSCGGDCGACAPYCGDGVCNNGETILTCPGDSCPSVCGDGSQTGTEACDNGPANQDGLYGGCSTTCTLNAYCGDGVCNGAETCASCAGDCGVCPPVQCADGLDNDGNGVTDWPADLGCTSAADTNEAGYIPNLPPQAQSVRLTEPDYCAQGPGGVVTWSFQDLNTGDTQASYRVQVDTSMGFTSPDVDSGKVNSGVNSFVIPQGVLAWNVTYRARVMVWDDSDADSSWGNMSLCIGPGCNVSNTSWDTPVHAYPSATDFSYTPASPRAGQVVAFSGLATCYDASNNPTACSAWNWTFGDGATATVQNPSHTYTDPGVYSATMYVEDGLAQQCPASPDPVSKAINVGTRLPRWREILPWFNTPVTGSQVNP